MIKFCTQVGKFQHTEVKSPKGYTHGHVTHFKFCGLSDISGTAEARVVKFCTQVDYISC